MRKLRTEIVILVAAVAACGGGRSEQVSQDESGNACGAYAAQLRRCLGSDDLQPVQHASAVAASVEHAEPAARAQLNEGCARRLAQLKASCR
jgi:hypothetical protein